MSGMSKKMSQDITALNGSVKTEKNSPLSIWNITDLSSTFNVTLGSSGLRKQRYRILSLASVWASTRVSA